MAGDIVQNGSKRSSGSINFTPAYILGPRLLIILSVLALVLIGFVMVYSTSSIAALSSSGASGQANTFSDALRQVIYALIGLVLAFVLWRFFPLKVWRGPLLWAVWGICFALLVATALFGVGEDEGGARRWLNIGIATIQVSEVAKIVFILVCAHLIDQFRFGGMSLPDLVARLLVFIGLPVGMILGLQSDLGTALICVAGIFAVLWVGEVPLRTMAIIGIVILALGCLAIFSTEYRRARFLVFMNPWNDGEGGYGTGYQLIHSFYALSSGGIFGVGLGNSHEKYLYLTQSESDFIFSIIGEEFGLIGALLVIALYLVFLEGGMLVARRATSYHCAMVAGACTLMIVFQAFLNICMVMGMIPVVGKPLPFVSSGGSSLVSCFIAVGLIMSVSKETMSQDIYQKRRADLKLLYRDSSRY